MIETLTIELHNRSQAWAAIKAQLYPFLASALQAGGRWVLTVVGRVDAESLKPMPMVYFGEVNATDDRPEPEGETR